MLRIFNIAIILNWMAALAVIGFAGISGDGLATAFAHMLESATLFALQPHIAQSAALVVTLSVLTAGIWAVLGVVLAGNYEVEQGEREFVITASFGFCLGLFAVILMLAAWEHNSAVGQMAALCSFATLFAAIALRLFFNQEARLPNQVTGGVVADTWFSNAVPQASSMARHSANAASSAILATSAAKQTLSRSETPR